MARSTLFNFIYNPFQTLTHIDRLEFLSSMHERPWACLIRVWLRSLREVVYKIPYRFAHTWPGECARELRYLAYNPVIIYSRVPEGSVLGPLLFLIYINDIVHSSTQGEFVIFADYTNIFIAAKTKKEEYNVSNHVLRYMYAYMHANQLHINLSKFAHMYFRPNFNYRERMKCARVLNHSTLDRHIFNTSTFRVGLINQ